MRRFLAALLLLATPAAAQDAGGLWKTQVSKKGGWLHVRIAPCAADVAKTCGLIAEAFKTEVIDLVGQEIISDMDPDGPGKWSGGRVWAPDDDKSYNSNMELHGEVLTVEGCVLFVCRDQNWTRVN
ncbi:MAG: hypothetical protein ACJA1L_003410 [Paracoccaceae bacterium]|jgi:uncharacterized protein (DUF2147 family)